MSSVTLGSDTLAVTPAAGAIEYNGQFYGTDSNASRAQFERLVLSTAVASTSGTSIDFTSIPAWVKRITVMFSGVSTNGTSVLQIQLGSGSVTTTGYLGSGVGGANTNTLTVTNYTTGFPILSGSASNLFYGSMVITNISGNTWVSNGNFTTSGTAAWAANGGNVALSGTIDRVRITTVNGTDTFDAGSINVLLEG